MSEKQVNDELSEDSQEEASQEETNDFRVVEGDVEDNFTNEDSMVYDNDDDFVIDSDESAAKGGNTNEHMLNLRLPKSLYNRLRHMAGDEGVSLEDLAFELISEGSVIRAWEIVEKKSTMRSGSGNQQGNQQGNPNNSGGSFRYRQNRNGGGGGGGGGQRRSNNNNNNNNNNRRSGPNIHKLMEDKASFLEYVRNQEKKNNR